MPIDKALKVNPLMETTPRMRTPAMAASIAVLLSLLGSNADALSLGRLTVKSALGQPLLAEIDIPEVSPEEADNLKGGVASNEAFKASGLEFSSAIANLQVSLQRRQDGKMFFRLSGDRVVNEPFVDLILEATWGSGRILRDYTLLFDPPSLRESPAPTAPQIMVAPAVPATAPAAVPGTAVAKREAPKPATQQPANPAPLATPASMAKPTAPSAPPVQVTVRPGDTASKLAAAHKPGGVSLDQMLVALLRGNPDAFLGNNINRLKSGAVLDLPSTDQAAATTPEVATQTVLAQSKDFGEFKRHLAGSAPAVAPVRTERQASGKIQAVVEDKKSPVAAPDKLTLSKANAQSKAAEDKIAAERQAKDAAARTAELARNIAELNKLKAGVASAPASAAPPAAVAAAASKPPLAIATTASIAPSASAPASAPIQAAASKPALPKPAASKPVVKASAPAPEPSFMDGLMEDPLIPGGALAVVGLLAGFAVYRSRKNKKSAAGDSSFLDSHLQPDSFFGASGGEQVDTSNDSAVSGGSSMTYSPSQLDAGGEVDPVAEADVYLAYGRDQQAEDILKDALQTTPSRLAIHAKLADIYAKRANVAEFTAIANTAHVLSAGKGQEWEHIRDLGHGLDRNNALFQQDKAAPDYAAPASKTVETAAVSGLSDPANLDFDLDFDSLPESSSADDRPSAMGVLHESDAVSEPMELFDAPPSSETPLSSFSALDQHEWEPDIAPTAPVSPAPAVPSTPVKLKSQTAASAPPQSAPEMLSFDLGALSLDLDSTPKPESVVAEEPDTDGLDPLATKLALAKEFQSIGDNDGAHALAEEVYTLGSGQLRADAKRFLSELGFAQSGFDHSTI